MCSMGQLLLLLIEATPVAPTDRTSAPAPSNAVILLTLHVLLLNMLFYNTGENVGGPVTVCRGLIFLRTRCTLGRPSVCRPVV